MTTAAAAEARVTTTTVTTKDGTQIYYKDWGTGQPVVFSHGWPLSADAWDDQMVFLASRGYRCIAHDRRGHGRSSQPWNGNDMDTYADDLAALVEALDLTDAIHVGHSTGGGEVARYIGRHGTDARRQGRADRRGAAADAEDRGQSRRSADRGVRRHPRRRARRPLAVLQGPDRCRSTATTGRARSSRKACATRSGCRACRPASRAPSTASRRSPRRTSPRT